jgi:hypothetical protein
MVKKAAGRQLRARYNMLRVLEWYQKRQADQHDKQIQTSDKGSHPRYHASNTASATAPATPAAAAPATSFQTHPL